jgi:hypothetical protein
MRQLEGFVIALQRRLPMLYSSNREHSVDIYGEFRKTASRHENQVLVCQPLYPRSVPEREITLEEAEEFTLKLMEKVITLSGTLCRRSAASGT